MIIYKVGNITEASEKYIAHGCNAQGKMRSGVAKAIRAKWPEAYNEYKAIYDHEGLELGSIVYVHAFKAPCPVICNCITQEFYGRDGKQYVDYDAIRSCMKELNLVATGDAIAIPKIGSALGGGDWNHIVSIIEEEIDGPVIVYVMDPKEIPNEME